MTLATKSSLFPTVIQWLVVRPQQFSIMSLGSGNLPAIRRPPTPRHTTVFLFPCVVPDTEEKTPRGNKREFVCI